MVGGVSTGIHDADEDHIYETKSRLLEACGGSDGFGRRRCLAEALRWLVDVGHAEDGGVGVHRLPA